MSPSFSKMTTPRKGLRPNSIQAFERIDPTCQIKTGKRFIQQYSLPDPPVPHYNRWPHRAFTRTAGGKLNSQSENSWAIRSLI